MEKIHQWCVTFTCFDVMTPGLQFALGTPINLFLLSSCVMVKTNEQTLNAPWFSNVCRIAPLTCNYCFTLWHCPDLDFGKKNCWIMYIKKYLINTPYSCAVSVIGCLCTVRLRSTNDSWDQLQLPTINGWIWLNHYNSGTWMCAKMLRQLIFMETSRMVSEEKRQSY